MEAMKEMTDTEAAGLRFEVEVLRSQMAWRRKHFPLAEFQRLTSENQALRAEVIELLERGGQDMDNKVRRGECVDNKAPWTRLDRINHRLGMWLLHRGRT